MHQYTPPEFHKSAFNCPRCHAFANIMWQRLVYYIRGEGQFTEIFEAKCSHCQESSYWKGERGPKGQYETGRMILPLEALAPLPHADMPTEIINDYEEARDIVNRSPRGAAALLRLVIQKLCKSFDEKGENLNNDIASLVKKGLPVEIQQSLDTVRVIGNNAVHPGNLSNDDVADVANSLFGLVNLIVDNRIAQPKRIKEIYDKLPKGAKDGIIKRDK